jgi:SAM-dependent methyltransferase
VGTDVNEEMATWCGKTFPDMEFHHNELRPPLKFAAESSFDLIYASSVFTHIPLETQGLWIRELHRILRPGGLAIVDVLGAYHQDRMLSPEDLQRLRKEGQLEITSTDDRASLSTKVIGSWDVFQTRGENLRVFGEVFEVLDYLQVILDLLVLRKQKRS